MLTRVLEPETLDHLEPADPAAQRSRRDLRRINWIMGATGILRRALEPLLADRPPGNPLRIVEIGCGDGRLMLDVARSAPGWAPAEITLLDRQALVSTETIDAYAHAGWIARPLEANVLAWAGAAADAPDAGASGARSDAGSAGQAVGPGSLRRAALAADGRCNVVVANLFLHHFDAATLRALLAGCARRADAVVACEPRRTRFALAASHLVGAVGANAVTRRDAVLSVRAGFLADELSAAWPARHDWQVDEYDDGLFTHVFRARRTAAPAALQRGTREAR